MNGIANWLAIAPELYTMLMVVVFLCLAFIKCSPQRDFKVALVAGLIGIAVCLGSVSCRAILFDRTYQVDMFSQVFKSIIYIGFFLVLCLCFKLDSVEQERHPEFYLLLYASTLAMLMLVSCTHLLNLYLCLEISSYSLYVLVYLRKGREKGLESALKYFIIGAAASALMLFGFAILYSLVKSAYLADLGRYMAQFAGSPLVLAGFIMALSGFFFKLAIFPFHFWIPDVYEGAPHQVAAYIATVSKVAAMAVLLRLMTLAPEQLPRLGPVLIFFSLMTMTIGNLSAIAQTDFKRMLAFSSVAHGGYILIGILSRNAMGQESVVFYATSVVLMKYACFMVLILLSTGGQNLEIKQLAGLHRRSPLLALVLLLALFGLAGIPPTIGFTGKLLLFIAATQRGLLVLVLLAMGNVVLSLYYYLKVLKAAYFDESQEAQSFPAVPIPMQIIALSLAILMVLIGLYPNPIIEMARAMIPLAS